MFGSVRSSVRPANIGDEDQHPLPSGKTPTSALTRISRGVNAVIPSAPVVKKSHKKKRIPGPRPRLGVGNLTDVMPDVWTAAKRNYRKYGPIVHLQLLGKHGFFITEPKYLEQLFALPDKNVPPQEIAPEGIFLSDGPKWQMARTVLQGRFIHKHMHEFIPLFTRKTHDMLQPLTDFAEAQTPVAVLRWFQEKMFEVICEGAFGYRIDSGNQSGSSQHGSRQQGRSQRGSQRGSNNKPAPQPDSFPRTTQRARTVTHNVKPVPGSFGSEDSEYPTLYEKFISNFDYAKEEQVSITRQVRKFAHTANLHAKDNGKFLRALAQIDDACDVIIMHKERQRRAEEQGGRGERVVDLLDQMMDHRDADTGEGFSRESIRGQMITLLVAGHKTSAILMAWALYLISTDNHVQERLLAEIDSIFQGDERYPTMEDVRKLTYAEQIIRETIRLYPPAQSVQRAVGDEDLELVVAPEDEEALGYTLPRKSFLFINVWDIHRIEKYWGNDAELFNPDRFEAEKMAAFHPYQFVPFGGGARSCIGNLFAITEVKVALCFIFRKFFIRKDAEHKIKIGADPCLPLNDIMIYFSKRKEGKSLPKVDGDRALLPKENPRASDGIQHVPQSQWVKSSKSKNTLRASGGPRRLSKDIKKIPLLILYGSNHGTCKDFATKLTNEAKLHHFEPKMLEFNALSWSYDYSQHFTSLSTKKRKNVGDDFDKANQMVTVLCVISSYNGSAPDNASKFLNFLKRDAHKVKQAGQPPLFDTLQYAVFGVGNSQWHATYQAVPKFIDQKLTELGGTRLYELTCGNENGDLDADFTSWKTLMWPLLGEELGLPIASYDDDEELEPAAAAGGKGDNGAGGGSGGERAAILSSGRTLVVSGQVVAPASFETVWVDAKQHGEYLAHKKVSSSAARPKGMYAKCKILTNNQLTQPKAEKACRHIEVSCYDTRTRQRLLYNTGDHLEVRAQNPESTVTLLCRSMGIRPDSYFRVEPHKNADPESAPQWISSNPEKVYSVKKVLSKYCNISGVPSRTLLTMLAQFASDESESEQLRELGSDFEEGAKLYNETVVQPQLTIACVLNRFTSVSLPFAQFLATVHTITPRFYSISSSPLHSPLSVHLSVGIVEYTTPSQRVHKGIGSTWVGRRPVGQFIKCKVHTSHFCLPNNLSMLIVCAATGTGLASF
eukprot:TRINITY_DN10415_c0_g1_i1.p1 TRINITY_DN10415_c0_g1~~TRINITY_DN10415_c0_g1_i1.p1  ORF type:complete len:1175 (+),score=182.21 TRINITY_DN10415_c0_g1_i1:42-3566(+)